jgi:hypothetical protein
LRASPPAKPGLTLDERLPAVPATLMSENPDGGSIKPIGATKWLLACA